MAEQQQANALAAAFPSPPPFYQYFSSENLERIAALRAESQNEPGGTGPEKKTSGDSRPQTLRLGDLPLELRFLQPPEPPAEGKYRSFGDLYNVGADTMYYLSEPKLNVTI